MGRRLWSWHWEGMGGWGGVDPKAQNGSEQASHQQRQSLVPLLWTPLAKT